jgi:hypothetical protein
MKAYTDSIRNKFPKIDPNMTFKYSLREIDMYLKIYNPMEMTEIIHELCSKIDNMSEYIENLEKKVTV